MDNYEFTTPKDFPEVSDVKKEGDTHRFLADIECTSIDDDGTMHWEIKALDGVKLPDEDEGNQEDESAADDATAGYDERQDEPSDGAPKTAKDVGAFVLSPPK